jgi:hypothetical protein
LLATVFLAASAAGLAGLFASAWRALAGGGVLARTGADGFDFAAIFFDFATALAMSANNPLMGRRCAPYTTFGRPGARREFPV